MLIYYFCRLLIGIYEKIIDLDAKTFLDKLVETSNLYSQITVSNTEDLNDFRKKEFQNGKVIFYHQEITQEMIFAKEQIIEMNSKF